MPLQTGTKVALVYTGFLLLAGIVAAGAFTLVSNAHKKEILALQNEIAARDVTIETQKGVYQKLAIQSNDLRQLLNQKDVQLSLLKEQLDKEGATLLTANTLIVQLKKKLESSGHVVVDPTDPKYPDVLHMSFSSLEDFSPFVVTGSAMADCSLDRPKIDLLSLKMAQARPLKLSVVVSQDKDGKWKTSTTSSEENFQIDIGLSAVNPFMLEPKWYEKIGLHADVGVGSGVLVGVGASYKIGKFTIGPSVWGTVNWDLAPKGYLGATMGWNPFQKD